MSYSFYSTTHTPGMIQILPLGGGQGKFRLICQVYWH